MSRKYKLFDLKNIPAPSFLMTPLELKEYIDFEVKRIYFITNPSGDKLTGSHCHLTDEDELFVMISGSCNMVVDDGSGLEEIKLEGPKKAVYIPHMVWHHFKNLSDDAILLAVTSTNYNPNREDYCEDYEEFKKIVVSKTV